MTMFTDDFPDVQTEEELRNEIKKYPHYDSYYVASGSIPERREKFDLMWEIFAPHADRHFLSEVKKQFHNRTWEMFVGNILASQEISFTTNNEGPDFLIERAGRKIWIECVTCSSGEGEDKVPPMLYGAVRSVPHVEMCIRIANALDDKFKQYQKDIEKGLVGHDDSYIIAVNSGMLPFPDGVIPLILNCVFAIGYPTITFPIDGGPSKSGWSTIKAFNKKNGSPVPMDFFIRGEHAGISAVLYSGKTVLNHSVDNPGEIALIDNFIARNPLSEQDFSFFKRYRFDSNGSLRL